MMRYGPTSLKRVAKVGAGCRVPGAGSGGRGFASCTAVGTPVSRLVAERDECHVAVCACVRAVYASALLVQLVVHTSNAFCLDFDPTGRYAATGGADGLISIIDTEELVCVRSLDRLE